LVLLFNCSFALFLQKQYQMKKILLLFTFVILSSCSKDDAPQTVVPVQLTPTKQNLAGKWIIKDYLKTDGSVVAEFNYCSSKRDYIIFNTTPSITYYTYNDQCISSVYQSCTDYQIDKKTIIACDNTIFDGKVVDLTATTMTIQYPDAVAPQLKATRFIRVSF